MNAKMKDANSFPTGVFMLGDTPTAPIVLDVVVAGDYLCRVGAEWVVMTFEENQYIRFITGIKSTSDAATDVSLSTIPKGAVYGQFVSNLK